MIPNIDPPPPWTPQGWSPNALRQSTASLAAEMPEIFETLRLANAPAPWYLNRRELSQAEVVALNVTPLDVCPAPGPNKSVVLWGALIVVEITVVFTSNPVVQFRYGSGLVPNNMAIGGFNPMTLGKHAAFGLEMDNPFFAFSPGAVIPINEPIQIRTTSALTGAGTLINCSCTVVYSLFDTPETA